MHTSEKHNLLVSKHRPHEDVSHMQTFLSIRVWFGCVCVVIDSEIASATFRGIFKALANVQGWRGCKGIRAGPPENTLPGPVEASLFHPNTDSLVPPEWFSQ